MWVRISSLIVSEPACSVLSDDVQASAAARLCDLLAASWLLNTPATAPLSLLPKLAATRRPAVSVKLRLSPWLRLSAEDTARLWLLVQL